MLLYGSIVLFCCFLYGVSAVLCKYGLQHDTVKHADVSWGKTIFSAVTNKYWLVGVLFGAAANVVILQVQSAADLSIVYPLLNFAYVFTLILGYVFLGEVLTREQWFGVAAAVAGTVLLLFVEDPSTGHQTDISSLGTMAVLSLIVIVVLLILAQRDKRQISEVYFATCAGIAFGNVEIFLKANTNLIIAEMGHFSILSGDSMLAFITLWPVMLIGAFSIIGFVCCQIAYAHGDVSVSVPLITVTQRPVTLFAGYFVFGEAFPPIKVIGIVTILLSIIGITASTVRKAEPVTT